MEKTDKTRLAVRPLTWRERLAGFYAGMSGLPLARFLDRIRSATLDAPLSARAPRRTGAGSQGITPAPSGAMPSDSSETGLASARKRYQALLGKLPAVVAREPPFWGPLLWIGFAGMILLGDAAFTFQALADALGVVTESLADAPSFTVLLVGVMTVLAVLANAAAGVRAKETVPLRRLGGWLLLFGCGVVLAVLRGAASAEASWALTLFGFLIPLVGGLAAGVAHEQVGAFLKRRARYRARERETDLALRASAAEVRRLEAHEQERRRASGSPETVARDPAAEARGRRILQARLAAARWVYALGARFAGRAGSGGKGGDGHA